MYRLRVIADDFTGACDIGAELLPLGQPVLVEGNRGGVPPGAEVVPIRNTQSRGVDVAEAVARVRQALGRPGSRGADLVLKKIDTALRGHVAAELEATLAATGVARAYVLAAIPEVGRVTLDGVQLIDGVPVANTPFARDPLNPVWESSIVTLLRTGGGLAVRHLPLAVVRDPGRLGAAVAEEADGEHGEAVVVDAVTDEDIERTVSALLARAEPVVLVGSIGLGRAIGRMLRTGTSDRTPPPEGHGGSPVLIVVGSVHPVASAQLRHAERQSGVRQITLAGEPGRAGREAGESLARDGVVALVSSSEQAAARPRLVAPALGEAAAIAARIGRPRALILIGGETAYHVTEALGGMPLRVQARVQPLMIDGRLTMPPHAGLRVLCKGGSSGAEDALTSLIGVVLAGV